MVHKYYKGWPAVYWRGKYYKQIGGSHDRSEQGAVGTGGPAGERGSAELLCACEGNHGVYPAVR